VCRQDDDRRGQHVLRPRADRVHNRITRQDGETGGQHVGRRRPAALSVLGEVAFNAARRVDEDLGGHAGEELLQALAVGIALNDEEVQIARRVGRAPDDRAAGDDADHVEAEQNILNGLAQGPIKVRREAGPGALAQEFIHATGFHISSA
jgi:hypothetical protein